MNHRNTKNERYDENPVDDLEERLEHVFDDMKGRENNRDRHAQKKMKDKDYRRKYEDDCDYGEYDD
jgi:protease II